MKLLPVVFVLLLLPGILFSQTITVDDNGIVRCKDVPIGTSQSVDGITYEVVDRSLLEQRLQQGADLSSGVYVYRLTTPEFTQSRLMSLVK